MTAASIPIPRAEPGGVRSAVKGRVGDWPRTTRVLPWSIALFLVCIWWAPLDAVTMRGLPFDGKLDRLLLMPTLLIWICSLAARGPESPKLRVNGVTLAIFAFWSIAVLSVMFNIEILSLQHEVEVAVKKLFLLFSYVAFFMIVSSVIRRTELRAFTNLVVFLAATMAIGVVIEYRLGTNIFYDLASHIFKGPFDVASQPADPEFGRPQVNGPTRHGLAATTLLALTLPFAISSLMSSRTRWKKFLFALATGLIIAGAVATLRKSAAFIPAAVLLTLLAYKPRQMIRLLPVGLILMVGVQFAAPGALASLRGQLTPHRLFSQDTYHDRKDDYPAVTPDVKTYPVFGRGFGAYDPDNHRFLDNEYLMELLTVGFVGLAAYFMMIASAALAAGSAARSRDQTLAPVAVAAVAGAAGFAMASLLFDAMSFAQAPYMFLFTAALGVIAATEHKETLAKEAVRRRVGGLVLASNRA